MIDSVACVIPTITVVLAGDLRRLDSWRAWCVNLHNDSPFYFTLLTITVVPLLSLAVGFITSFVFSRIGIDLKASKKQISERS